MQRFFLGGEVGDHADALEMVLCFSDHDNDVAMVEDEVLLVLEVLLHILRGAFPQLLEIPEDGLWFRGKRDGEVMVATGVGRAGFF